MAILSVASPACSTSEDVFANGDGSNVHSYAAVAPSLSRQEIQRRFRQVAARLGYAVTCPSAGHLQFADKAKRVGAVLLEDQVTLFFARSSYRPSAAAPRMAAEMGLDAAVKLGRMLGESASWESVKFQRLGSGVTLGAVLVIPRDKLPVVETWVKRQKLQKDGDSWIRTFDPARPEQSAVMAELSPDSKLSIQESRLEKKTNLAACAEPRTGNRASPRDGKPPTNESDDDLMRQMLQQRQP